ncbi:hypothetical protein M8C21_011620, partial [Ambrosia artemisiifolia]
DYDGADEAWSNVIGIYETRGSWQMPVVVMAKSKGARAKVDHWHTPAWVRHLRGRDTCVGPGRDKLLKKVVAAANGSMDSDI